MSETTHPLFPDARRALASIDQTHRPVHVRPSGDATLAYVIPIPAGWMAALGVEREPSDRPRPDVLGVFATDGNARAPRVVVSASRPQWEVDALEYTRAGLIVAGWWIAVARWLDRPAGRFEVGAIRQEDRGRSEVRRCIGFLDGGRILRVDTIAPTERWRGVYDQLWPCGMLFDLDEPTEDHRIERWRTHEGPLLRFSLPASWAVSGTIDEEAFRVHWIADIAEGVQYAAALRVDATRTTKPVLVDVRHIELRDDLKRRDLVLARRIDRVADGDDPGRELPGWLGLYRCDAVDVGGDRFEVWLAHREIAGIRIDYVLLAPPKGTHHLDWMRATRALEIAIKTTETPDVR